MKYFLKTFWCQMNYADSEKINLILFQSWFKKTNDMLDADLVIFNTCSVRQKWEDRVFGFMDDITKKKKTNESKIKTPIVWITWCMVRKTWVNEIYLDPDKEKRKTAKKISYMKDKNSFLNNDDKLFPRIPSLDFSLRIEDVSYMTHILSHIFETQIWSDHKFDDYLKSKQLRDNKSSASIIIQKWCDNMCSFCIVPFTRDRETSRSLEDIVSESKNAVDFGAKEITLLGQNVNSYWKQFVDSKLWNKEIGKWNITDKNLEIQENTFKSPFRELLEEIDKIKWLDRIRFTSSNPHDMTKDILDAHFELKSTCNYLHFALQSWSNQMLKKMNRKHTYEDFKEMINYLRWKDPLFSISTDIIVWFSWETEEMFQQTVKAMKEIEFDFVYIARYSVRPGTIASKIYPDDINQDEKARRWHILNNILLETVQKRNSLMIWREEEVLVWWKKEEEYFWRTRNFKEVFFKSKSDIKTWDLVKVKLKELNKYVIKGERV